VANCGVNPSITFADDPGVGGTSAAPDNVFGATYSEVDQDYGDQVVAFNAGSNACYFHNTKYGTVHSYIGAQTPTTGTLTCDGTATVTGSFGAGGGGSDWVGLNLTIGRRVYQIAAGSSSSLTLNATCPIGSRGFSVLPGTYLGAVTSPDLYSIHDVRMDPAGKWIIVEEGVRCYSSSCVVIHAWQIGTTTVSNCYYTVGGSDAGACDAHYTETASGWINADYFASNTHSPSMQLRSWANLPTTNSALVQQLNAYNGTALNDPNFDDHPTAKNDPFGTHGYPILTSTYVPDDPNDNEYVYSNEIIGWTQEPGPVLRFGHDFNSSNSPQFTAQNAIGAASSTGQFYMFTTDGEGTLGSNSGDTTCSVAGGTCRSDVFILNLAPPPAN
jgi:hypothetical protein